jgi:hypothetical protein
VNDLILTRQEEAKVLRDRANVERKGFAKMRRAINGPKLAKTDTGKATRGRETDPGFLAYLRRQPCEARALGGCAGPIEAAHVRYSDAKAGSVNPGMARKNHDRHANPLCRFHHQHDQHAGAERAFWARVGRDAYATAAGHFAAYRGQP